MRVSGDIGLLGSLAWSLFSGSLKSLRWNRTLFIRRFKLPRGGSLPPKSSYFVFSLYLKPCGSITTYYGTVYNTHVPHTPQQTRQTSHRSGTAGDILRRCPWHGAPSPSPLARGQFGPVSRFRGIGELVLHCGIRESLPHYSLLYLRLPSLR